jgi:hypothetical protein
MHSSTIRGGGEEGNLEVWPNIHINVYKLTSFITTAVLIRAPTDKDRLETEPSTSSCPTVMRAKNDEYGCLCWQPSASPEGETVQSRQQQQESLVQLHETQP